MIESIKKEWLSNLTNGLFKQTYYDLRCISPANKRCVIGVLIETLINLNLADITWEGVQYKYNDCLYSGCLNDELYQLCGFTDDSFYYLKLPPLTILKYKLDKSTFGKVPEFKEIDGYKVIPSISIADLNDLSVSFSDLAEIISLNF